MDRWKNVRTWYMSIEPNCPLKTLQGRFLVKLGKIVKSSKQASVKETVDRDVWSCWMLDRSNGDTSYNQVSRLSINHWLLCTVVLWIFSFWISIRGSTLDFFICFTNISQKIWSYLELAMTSIYMSQSSILERVLSESVRIWPKQTKYSADTLATMIQHNQQGCIEMNSQALTTSTDLVTDIFLCKQLLKFIYINSLNPKILFFFLSLVLTISTLLVQHMRLIFLQKSLKFNPSIGRTKHIILILHLLILSNHQ